MSEDFTIQCQSCGTIYNDLQEACPYCGSPQPAVTEEPSLAFDEHLLDSTLNEEMVPDQPEIVVEQFDPPLATGSRLHDDLDITDEPVLEVYLPEDDTVLSDEYIPPENPFGDDDIFAVVGEDDTGDDEGEEDYNYAQADELEEPEEFDGLDQLAEAQDFAEPDVINPFGEREYYGVADSADEGGLGDTYDEPDVAPRVQPFTFRRLLTGCLLTVVCLTLFYGVIGVAAVREGLQDRAQNTQAESQEHFQRGQEYLANNSLELAIAEFERALSLNPNLLSARQSLREAQRISQAQPTATSETRSAAVIDFLAKAEGQIGRQSWTGAIETLLQVRGLDPTYQAGYVSGLLYTAHYELGLQLSNPQQIEEAIAAFDQALIERPGDFQTATAQAKAVLYLDGLSLETSDKEKAIEIFIQLYQQDENYLDVRQHLWLTYDRFGDELARADDWCRAEIQYTEAYALQPTQAIQLKAENVSQLCQNGIPTQKATARATPTSAPTPTPDVQEAGATSTTSDNSAGTGQPAQSGSGAVFFSRFNPNESRWEIVSAPVKGGPIEVRVINGTMPAVSPDGQLILYRAELIDAEGFHTFNLTSAEDRRITTIRSHILPRWGGSNDQFLFSAQEAGTGRWQVYLGFADGKSDPIILRDGRTPGWSEAKNIMAYQGTNSEGNNPGIYIAPLGSGEPIRLTTHESDRSPVFSPDGSQLAYMSTRSGNWDLYTINAAGSTPIQVTTAPGNDGLPSWSPDGKRLAYVSDADGSWAIYTIAATGGTPTKLIEWDGLNHADWLLTQIWWAR